MKIQIAETNKIETLTILDKNGIDWTADLITAGGMPTNENGTVIMSLEDLDWWTNYINDHEKTELEAVELIEELEDQCVECPVPEGWAQYVANAIAENTGNDYDGHRKSAVKTIEQIKADYLLPQVGDVIHEMGEAYTVVDTDYQEDNHIIKIVCGKLKKWITDVKIDLMYSKKSFALLFAKFVSLQAWGDYTPNHEEDGAWEKIDPENTWCDSYYVCALFSNGKHLPLPLVLASKGGYPLQNVVLSVLRRVGALKEAEKACEEYVAAEIAAENIQTATR